MNKTELAARVAEDLEISNKMSLDVINAVLDVISETLAGGDSVIFTGFGKFEAVTTPARIGRNPKTGEAVDIPARKVVKFRVGKALKDSVDC